MRRRGYGIPYQGSKGAHAGRIYRCIAQRHPDARTLVDPFCGGWAVAHAFTRAGWSEHACVWHAELRSARSCACARGG